MYLRTTFLERVVLFTKEVIKLVKEELNPTKEISKTPQFDDLIKTLKREILEVTPDDKRTEAFEALHVYSEWLKGEDLTDFQKYWKLGLLKQKIILK